METETIDKLYLDADEVFEIIDDILMFMFPSDEQHCNKITYFDKECTKRQGSWKRRSIDDLYIICQTYFSEASKLDILKAIQRCKLHFYICDDINRVVFHRVRFDSAYKFGLDTLTSHMGKHSAYLEVVPKLKDSYAELINLLTEEKEQCLEKNSLELEVA